MVAALGSGRATSAKRSLIGATPRLRLRDLPRFGKSVVLGWGNPARVPLVMFCIGSMDGAAAERAVYHWISMFDIASGGALQSVGERSCYASSCDVHGKA